MHHPFHNFEISLMLCFLYKVLPQTLENETSPQDLISLAPGDDRFVGIFIFNLTYPRTGLVFNRQVNWFMIHSASCAQLQIDSRQIGIIQWSAVPMNEGIVLLYSLLISRGNMQTYLPDMPYNALKYIKSYQIKRKLLFSKNKN